VLAFQTKIAADQFRRLFRFFPGCSFQRPLMDHRGNKPGRKTLSQCGYQREFPPRSEERDQKKQNAGQDIPEGSFWQSVAWPFGTYFFAGGITCQSCLSFDGNPCQKHF
jgi:hypothetical protein